MINKFDFEKFLKSACLRFITKGELDYYYAIWIHNGFGKDEFVKIVNDNLVKVDERYLYLPKLSEYSVPINVPSLYTKRDYDSLFKYVNKKYTDCNFHVKLETNFTASIFKNDGTDKINSHFKSAYCLINYSILYSELMIILEFLVDLKKLPFDLHNLHPSVFNEFIVILSKILSLTDTGSGEIKLPKVGVNLSERINKTRSSADTLKRYLSRYFLPDNIASDSNLAEFIKGNTTPLGIVNHNYSVIADCLRYLFQNSAYSFYQHAVPVGQLVTQSSVIKNELFFTEKLFLPSLLIRRVFSSYLLNKYTYKLGPNKFSLSDSNSEDSFEELPYLFSRDKNDFVTMNELSFVVRDLIISDINLFNVDAVAMLALLHCYLRYLKINNRSITDDYYLVYNGGKNG